MCSIMECIQEVGGNEVHMRFADTTRTRTREDRERAKLERAQLKLERIQRRESKHDTKVQAKMDKISQKLEETRTEIEGSSPKELSHKKTPDSGDDYEILDD